MRYAKHSGLRPLFGLPLLLSLWVAACGGGGDDGPNIGSGGGTGIVFGTGGNTSPPGSNGSGNGTGFGNSTGTGNVDSCGDVTLDGCAGESYEGESIPLDIYVMFDQSGSMNADVGGLTRLQAVQRATASFLADPKSASIGVGIGYFGFLPVTQVSCDPKTYAPADVGITLDHAQIVSSLNARKPTGETPTAAAIRGACSYITGYRQKTPGHRVVMLLVTDGIPEAPASCNAGGCCPTLEDAVAAATECSSGSGVPIYVLGVGPQLDNLNQIAVAGGTQTAYLVGNQDVANNVLSALLAIRRAAIPCDLEIPPARDGQTIDYSKINVLYARGGCQFKTVFGLESVAQCDPAQDGWYYDDPNHPTTVKLCPSTCGQVSQPDATLRFFLGCTTVEPPVK